MAEPPSEILYKQLNKNKYDYRINQCEFYGFCQYEDLPP
jgi:hypothetical protein